MYEEWAEIWRRTRFARVGTGTESPSIHTHLRGKPEQPKLASTIGVAQRAQSRKPRTQSRATWQVLFTENNPLLSKCHMILSSGRRKLTGIERIRFVSKSENKWEISCCFQHFLSPSMRSETKDSGQSGGMGEKIWNDEGKGIYLSCQMWMLSPELMRHLDPLQITSRAAQMLLQVTFCVITFCYHSNIWVPSHILGYHSNILFI